MRVNSVMILVVLSTNAELASATARGRSYCETGLFQLRSKIQTNLHLQDKHRQGEFLNL